MADGLVLINFVHKFQFNSEYFVIYLSTAQLHNIYYELCNSYNLVARDNSLKKFAGANWFGCHFLNQEMEMQESQLQEQLDELKARLALLGCSEDNLTHAGSKLFPQSCNWKVFQKIRKDTWSRR